MVAPKYTVYRRKKMEKVHQKRLPKMNDVMISYSMISNSHMHTSLWR